MAHRAGSYVIWREAHNQYIVVNGKMEEVRCDMTAVTIHEEKAETSGVCGAFEELLEPVESDIYVLG